MTKIGIVHLYTQGYVNEELVDFELELTLPSTIYEQEKLELWDQKSNLSSGLVENKVVSSEWIYKNIWKFTDDEIKDIRLEILADQKRKFRWSQIEMEGNDPVKSGEAVGTAGSMEGEVAPGEQPQQPQPPQPPKGAPTQETSPVGRPKEPPKFKKDNSARGRDPVGSHDMKKGGSNAKKYGRPLHLDHIILSEDAELIIEDDELQDAITNQHFFAKSNISHLTKQLEKKFGGKFGKKNTQVLAEAVDVKAEYESEIKQIEQLNGNKEDE